MKTQPWVVYCVRFCGFWKNWPTCYQNPSSTAATTKWSGFWRRSAVTRTSAPYPTGASADRYTSATSTCRTKFRASKRFFSDKFLLSPFSNKQRVRLKNKIIFSPGWFRTEWRRCDRVVHERSQAALLQGQPDSVRKFRWQAGKVWWVSFLQ